MINEFTIINGTSKEIFDHISDRKDFDMWLPYKEFSTQILEVSTNKWRVGPIIFYTRNEKNERCVTEQWVIISLY